MPKKPQTKRSKSLESFKKKVEAAVEYSIDNVDPKPVEPSAQVEEKKFEAPNQQPIKLYRALANLSDNGKIIAAAGEEIVLADSLAAHYNKYAPGSIEEIK